MGREAAYNFLTQIVFSLASITLAFRHHYFESELRSLNLGNRQPIH